MSKNKIMSTITIHLKDKEEETLIQNLLQKMKISFEKEEEDDFELTEEMIEAIERGLQQDKSTAVDGRESLKRIRAKYGI